MEEHREQVTYRGGGGGGGYNPRHDYPRETPRDVTALVETERNRQRSGSMEELVFDEDSGQLVAKKQKSRPLAGQTVLTGIATSGFFWKRLLLERLWRHWANEEVRGKTIPALVLLTIDTDIPKKKKEKKRKKYVLKRKCTFITK